MVQFGQDVMVQVGSGRYTFTYRSEALATHPGIDPEPVPILSLENTIGELLAIRQSRMILYRHLPELCGSPWLSQVMGFTLRKAMQSLPDRFRVSNAVLEGIMNDLKELAE
jgi:hypothetical protein